MTEKEIQITAAALRVFMRYGLSRATMADIAKEAGVVRQTLYNVFANKDEVIRGTVFFYVEGQRLKTLEDWKGVKTLSEKIDILFQNHVITPWHELKKAPDAGEFELSAKTAANMAFEEAAKLLHGTLADLYAPYRHGLEAMGNTPEALAQFTEITMHAIKHAAEAAEVLERNLFSLKASLLLITGHAVEPLRAIAPAG